MKRTVARESDHAVSICSSRAVSIFVAGSENDKSGAKRAAKVDSDPGPPNKVIAMC